MKTYSVILSGGGTGGHIYPAVATAQALQRLMGERVRILFAGAEGRMEMEKIPALGYDIEGLPVAGLQRSLAPRVMAGNLLVPFKVLRSVVRAKDIIRRFGADAVAGFGGYASAPVLYAAQRAGIPTLIQEQNSHAGLTNRILARRARVICTAYEGMERFFDVRRTVLTGNPLRGAFSAGADREQALKHFGLHPGRPVLLVVGGSLGTRTLNEMMKAGLERITAEGRMQVIWQTGSYYRAETEAFLAGRNLDGIWHGAFIDRMDLAYAAADAVISRSGACTVSELCIAGKPTIFVPSPNVAEDHQTKNAMALVNRNAARMVPDALAVQQALPLAEQLLSDAAGLQTLSRNISSLAIADSADRVARQIMRLMGAND